MSSTSMNACWWFKGLLTFGAALTLTLLCGSLREKKPHILHTNGTVAFDRNQPPPNYPAALPIGDAIECYTPAHTNYRRIELLADILEAEQRPTTGRHNIFFHATDCQPSGIARLHVRQACAVEAAARLHPSADVFVLFAAPVGFERSRPRPEVVSALATYANVHWRTVNLWQYMKRTPAEDWMDHGQLFASRYLPEHMADMLRLASVYKYGGTAIDLDVLVRRPLNDLPANYAAAAEDGPDVVERPINVGLLDFARTGAGHRLVELSLGEFARSFRPDEWSANGAPLLERVLREHCRRSGDRKQCADFTVYPGEMVGAVETADWRLLFDPEQAELVERRLNGSRAVRLWSAWSGRATVRVGGGSAYERLAQELCPRVYATVPEGRAF